MTVAANTKEYLANYISHLFKIRKETFEEDFWYCVLRNDQLMVIRPYTRESGDIVIVACYLKPGRSPSKISIHLALRKNWQVFSGLNSESLNRLIEQYHPAGVNCMKGISKKQKYIANLKLCLNQFKSFFENSLRWMRIQFFM